MATKNSWISSVKLILTSAGVLSVALALKVSIPIAVDGIPALWSTVLSCTKPPYLYIIINGIIITIAASSRFHHSQAEPAAARSDHLISVKTPPPETFESISSSAEIYETSDSEAASEVLVSEVEDRVVDLKPVMVNGSKVDSAAETDLIRAGSEDVFDESTLPYNPPLNRGFSPEAELESLFPVREKPLASSRFVHRKQNRITPEAGGARALRRVARPKKQETLESTWKMITEGRHVPLTRHLKKSDTWEHHSPPNAVHVVPKSETFKERSSRTPPPAKIRKEPSLSQDELNRRVEAFIHKFNEEMKMQRQESLNKYTEMINRGV